MSLITTPSSVLSVLKLRQGPNCNSRGTFHVPSNIKTILLNHQLNRNSTEYQSLISTMRDTDISDAQLLSLIEEVRNFIPMLNYDLRLFVQAINIIKWAERGDEIAKVYQEFLSDLVTAHSQHCKVVIDQHVKLFLIINNEDWLDFKPVDSKEREFNNIQIVLKSVSEKVPLSVDILLESLTHNFPHFLSKTSPASKLCYVYNLLKLTSYQPDLRDNVLRIIFDKLLVEDVHTSVEDILQSEEEQGGTLFKMEMEGEHSFQKLRHPVADTLDGIMVLLIKFINNECYEENNLNQVKAQKLFKELVKIFDKLILPFHTHHIQFIMFYYCRFQNSLVQQFLKYLWMKSISPHFPTAIRQNCISYMVGLLARGEYVLLGYLKIYMSKIAEWINQYISTYCDNDETKRNDHSMFYSMCNAVFYLVVFRHEDLVHSSSKLSFLQGLNLSKIVTCNLNPLRACPAELLDRFADITCGYQLAYCYTIIENNSRNTLTVVDKYGNVKNPIKKMYFPFDPLILPRMNTYIKPIYREYNPFVKCSGPEHEDKKNEPNSQSSSYKKGLSPMLASGSSFEN